MRFAATSSFTGFVSHRSDRSIRRPARRPVPSLPATIETVPTEPTATSAHRALVRASSLLIVALLDLTCILWVYPIANQLAEWADVSVSNSIYVGFAAMLASIPLVVIASMGTLFRLKTRSKTEWDVCSVPS